jgi:hypothetical protein
MGWHHHDRDGLAAACAAFRCDWDEWWAAEHAGFRVLGINTQISGSGLPEEGKQSAWLLEQLAAPRRLPLAVFGHTPLYLRDPEEDWDDGSEQMCLKPAARAPLLEILRRHPPDLLISAHAHRYWRARQESWEWLGVPATALGQDEMLAVPSHALPRGDDEVGWVELSHSEGSWESLRHRCA